MKKTAFVLLVVTCLMFGLVGTARAWWETNTTDQGGWAVTGPTSATGPGDCNGCHGASTTIPYGPHGGFSSTTDSCKSCHDVHEAGSVNKLLPSTTELGICNACHDFSFTGTGGRGVYGAIRARGVAAQSRHNILGYNNTDTAPATPANTKSYAATEVIPGGQTGFILPTNSAGNRQLTCTHCHTPHGNTVMKPWVGERERSTTAAPVGVTSNRILQDDVLGAPKGTYTDYDADWCARCHMNRHDSSQTPSAVNNHPVVYASVNATYGSTFQSEAGATWNTLNAAGSTITTQHLAGFSREATLGWKPMCQQCHEDYRNVEQAFSVTSADGTNSADNPRFQTFPHENMSQSFVVESGDDLCLNCHPTLSLP